MTHVIDLAKRVAECKRDLDALMMMNGGFGTVEQQVADQARLILMRSAYARAEKEYQDALEYLRVEDLKKLANQLSSDAPVS